MDCSKYTLKELNLLTFEYIRLHWSNGGRSEFDTSINDISRAIIGRYREKHGQCYLGRINRRENSDEAFLIPYTGQKVFNFQYDVLVPCRDEKLSDMLEKHNVRKGFFDSDATWERITTILERIKELDGTQLIWA